MRSLVLLAFALAHAQAATVLCVSSGAPALVRAEGVAERLGDILLSCSGPPGASASGSLMAFLGVNVTNRISANGTADAILTLDPGAGPIAGVVSGANAVSFSGLNLVLPASGRASLRISNLRGAVSQKGLSGSVPIDAFLSGPANLAFDSPSVTVAFPQRALLASAWGTTVFCGESPLPSEVNLANLTSAGTQMLSVRVTEGYAGAFQKRGALEDSGTRILVRYSGFPPGARLFVPDLVAGSGSLLLARVVNADPNGAGGFPVLTSGIPGSGVADFNSASEVRLSGGAGAAAYEVLDSDPSFRESALVPTFLGLEPVTDARTALPEVGVSLAPVSTVDVASSWAPVPRFVAAPPPGDCAVLGECAASVQPKLAVDGPPLTFTASSGSAPQLKVLQVRNETGGDMNWIATITYKTGSGWLRMFPTAARGDSNPWVEVHPESLAPGNYEATLLIDAGSVAGNRSLPVQLQVTPALPKPPAVESAVNAASLAPGPVVPGSLATLKGARLAGKQVSASFDGLPAKLLYVSAEQINLLVPPELGAQSTARLVVAVDGVSSAPLSVALSPVAPAIFANGVLNQDNSVNSAANPAVVGSIVQVFATGLPLPNTGVITARLHDWDIATPYYGGPAPGLPGVQQVNILVPDALPAMTTEVRVCGSVASQRVCSAPAQITLRR